MNSNNPRYPIAQRFVSPQGEGFFSGQVMDFIRLAGCSVGKKYPKEAYERLVDPLPVWQEECHTWDGRSFPCDTNFQTKHVMSAEDIFETHEAAVEHICITGGEPMNYNLLAIYASFFLPGLCGFRMHIETSGTVSMEKSFGENWKFFSDVWVTVSPKLNALPEMMQRANEVKFLVDELFDVKKAEELLKQCGDNKPIVWLSPINGIQTIDSDNCKRVLDIAVYEHPDWRITTQLHKILGCD